MFNRIKLLRVLTTVVFSIATLASMQTNAYAVNAFTSMETGINNPSFNPIYVGEKVFVWTRVVFPSSTPSGDIPVQANFTLTDEINHLPATPTPTFNAIGEVATDAACSPSALLVAPINNAGPNTVKVFCWWVDNLPGGDNNITATYDASPASTFFPVRFSQATVTINKPTPTVVVSTVTHQYDESRDPSPSASPSPSDSPTPVSSVSPSALPSPDASSPSSQPTPGQYPNPNPSSAANSTNNVNAYANKGDTVDIYATVYWDHTDAAFTPNGYVYFYQQDPNYTNSMSGPNTGGGLPIQDRYGKYGCNLADADLTPNNINTPPGNSATCHITVNASDLFDISIAPGAAIGTHGLVAVYVGNLTTNIPVASGTKDPASEYGYDAGIQLHGVCGGDCDTWGNSYLDNSHFGTADRLLFETISGDNTLGDTNFTGAVSGYGNLNDSFSRGDTFLINIYRGWAHVYTTVSPVEPTQYGETVTFFVEVVGDTAVGNSVTPADGGRGLGVKLTDQANPNAPPIYLYCATEDIVDTSPYAAPDTNPVGSGCEITTELLHPFDQYIVDAFYLGNADYQPTTYRGYDESNPLYSQYDPYSAISLGDYLSNYFFSPEDSSLINRDTTNQSDTDANWASWSGMYGFSGVSTYNFFNDINDYVLTTHEITKADPVVEITSIDPTPSEYGQDVTFTVTVTNPHSTNTLLDFPTGGVTLTTDDADQEDWTAECTWVDNSVDAVTANYTCHSATLLANEEHTITATYEGDSNYNEATTTATHTVNKVDPVVEISADPETTAYGEMAKFTVVLSNPYDESDLEAPTGVVTLTTDDPDQTDWVAECTFESNDADAATYTCETPTLFEGTHTLNVHYVGDDNYLSNEATTMQYIVTKYEPEVTVESNPESTLYGEDVTFTVHVSGTDNEGVLPPAGTVVLTSSEQPDWVLECSFVGTDASTYTCSGLSPTLLSDNHDIIATFTPEESIFGDNYSSAEGEMAYSVDLVTPIIDFTADQDSTVYGQDATFTVILTNPLDPDGLVPPTGEVTLTSDIQEDWDAECTVESNNRAQTTYTCLSATLLQGVHTLTASYGGDDNYGVTDATIIYTVNHVDPVVEITSDPESTKYGEEVTFTIVISNPYSAEDLVAPTGDVTLSSDLGDWTATCTFESSEGSESTYECTSPTLLAGDHSIYVHYVGDENYNPSDLTYLEYTVEAYTPEVTITTDVESTQYGDEVTFTVTLEGTGNEGVLPPTGTVVLTSSEQEEWTLECGNVTTDGSTYTCSGISATLLANSHDITATFTTDDTNYTDAEGDLTYEVTKQDPYMTMEATPADNNTYGTNTTFTITLSGTDKVDSPETGAEVLAPTGDVTLTDSVDPEWIVECSPVAGLGVLGGVTYTCSGTSPTLSVGTHAITASYEGDDNYEETSFTIETYEVAKYTPAMTVEVSSEPAEYGDEQTITVTIAGTGNEDVIAPSAQVITLNDPASNWSYSGVPSCETNDETVTLTCTVTTTHLFAGQYPIHATYAGDDNYEFNEATSEADVNISKAILDVTPAETLVSIDYGSTTVPAFDAKIEGFKNNEDASSFVPNQATTFPNEDGLETTVAGNDWFQAPVCSSPNLFLPSGEMANADSSGIYYNCSGGNADNYVFEHSGNGAISIRQTTAQLQITSNALTATYGQKIDFTVRLINNSGAPVESTEIQISSGETILGVCTLGDVSRNTCGITTDVLPVGINTVTASWNGSADVNFAVPSPASMQQPVVQAPVTIVVTSNHNPATPDDNIILTATVKGTSTPPTGTVTFAGGISEIVAECSPVVGTNYSTCVAEVGSLNPAIYDVTVQYSGDDNYISNETSYIQAVQFLSTGVNVDPANATSIYGDAVEFTVTVPGDAELNPTAWPTGRVTITDNNRTYSVGCDLVHIAETVNSSCVITVIGMEVGVHQILASYAGDSIFPASYDVTSHHVQIHTTTSIASSKNAAEFGDSVTLTATVSSERGAPSNGTIEFREGETVIGTCNLFGATCSVTFANVDSLSSGMHNIVAVFLPSESSDFLTSESAELAQRINELNATVTITQNLATTYAGQTVNFTVNVVGNAYTPTGTAHITITSAGATEEYDCTLANGSCTVGTYTLPFGTYTVSATYSSDIEGSYPSADSGEITHEVVLNGTSVAISSSKNPSIYNDSVTFTALVTSERGVPASGSIAFFDGETPLDVCPVVAGTCSITLSSLEVRTHPITAVFTPTEGSNFHEGTSAELDQVVSPLQTWVTVSSNLEPALFGQTITFTVNVRGNSHLPTGNASIEIVDLSADPAFLETLHCVVVNGHCSVATYDLEPGTYTVTAYYEGDGIYSEDTSPEITQHVNEAGLLTVLRESPTTHTLVETTPNGDGLINLSVKLRGNAGQITGNVTFHVDGKVLNSPTAKCVRSKDSSYYYATCSLNVLASVLHSYNPSVEAHEVTVSYNGGGLYPSTPIVWTVAVLDPAAPSVESSVIHIVHGIAPYHTVNFNGNSVDSRGSMTPLTKNAPTALTANAFTREGFTFNGWNTLALPTEIEPGVSYGPSATYNFASDVTLYAQWAIANHTVTFKANNGVGADVIQTTNLPAALTSNSFTREGYTFVGWNTDADGVTGTSYTDGQSYPFTSDMKLHAIWSLDVAATHTVLFNSNTADSLGSMTAQSWNADQALTLNGYSRPGYAFTGWTVNADGSGDSYTDGEHYAFTSDVTLYAQWEVVAATEFTVNFDANTTDESLAGTMPDQVSDASASLTTNTFTRDGYTFAGWTTNENGTGDVYLDGATYSFTSDLFLFAKWTADTLTVTYNSQGGSEVAGTTTVTGGTLTTSPGTTTRAGYDFVGWFMASEGGTAVNLPFPHGQNADFTIYAQWTPATPAPAANHTVLFNSNSVDSLGSMTPQITNAHAALTANGFTRPGYTFAGWNTNSDGTSGTNYTNSQDYAFTADMTLFAKWTATPAPSFTVTFDKNGSDATGTMDNQVANTTTVLSHNGFSRSGYTFNGWSIVADGAVVYAQGVTYPFTANITLFAKWTANYVAPAPYTPPPAPSAATPVLSWVTPAPIVVGTALSATQLNALVTTPAGLSGTYSYSPAAGTLLAVGSYTLTVVFTPTDLVTYTTATKTVTQVVTPLGTTPVPTGPSAATINLGDGSGTYDKTGHEAPVTISPANCTYTITYNGSTAVPVNAGSYNVIVTAYGNCTGTATRTLVIAKATPNIEWLDPADITTTTPLSSTQLNATADVPGSFAYSPAAKRLLPAGTQILGATFTPTDSANYESVNVNATINVKAAVLSQTLVSFFALASSTIPADQLLLISTASITPGQQIVVTGYAQPSNNAAADLKLGLARANAVKAQILKKNPKAKITVKTLGSKYQPLCAKALNKCVVIVLK